MTAEASSTADVESGTTANAEQIALALTGITLGRSYPATIPECPHCHEKKVMTKLDTHATLGTYLMCVVLGILSLFILWWIPLILDSVSVSELNSFWCESDTLPGIALYCFLTIILILIQSKC